MRRLRYLHVLIALAAALLCVPATGQEYPSRTVIIILPFGAGGPLDVEARLLASFLEKAWTRSVLVENRPGAGGQIGAEVVVRAPADGHTLLLGTAALTTYKVLVKDVAFDPLRDLAPVSLVLNFPSGLVTNTQIPVKNVDEFISYAKANPGKLNSGSFGRDSAFLVIESFKRASGLQMTDISYSGLAPAVAALVRNDVQLINGTLNLALKAQVDAGKQWPLLMIGNRRSQIFPDVPTAAERGWKIPNNAWLAIFAPAGTPKAVIDRAASSIASYVASPEAQKHGADNGSTMVGSTPEQLRQTMESDSRTWADTAAAIGLKPE
jgi:tripartite-type tricarboxylate transporter receptor subunit TctC